jgi:hypothetical protein
MNNKQYKRREITAVRAGIMPARITLIACLLLVLYSLGCHSQDLRRQLDNTASKSRISDTIVFFFRTGDALLLKEYVDNNFKLAVLDSILSCPGLQGHIDTVYVKSAASPVGSSALNMRLSAGRGESLKNYILWKHPGFTRERIVLKSIGIDWPGFCAVLKKVPDFPNREKLLSLPYLTASDNDLLAQVRDKSGVSGHRYLARNIFPCLQYASVWLKMKDGNYADREPRSLLESLVENNHTILPLLSDTVPLPAADTLNYPIAEVKDTVYEPHTSGTPPSFIADSTSSGSGVLLSRIEDKHNKRLLAVGTNLLYDLALFTNLSLEIPVGERYSLLAQGASVWLQTKAPDYWSYRIQMLWLEGRYWWRNSPVALRGAFAGIYGAIGSYDIRLFPKGPEPLGTLSRFSYSLGLTAGYSIPIARRWNMEFSLGAGYLGGKYEEYNHSCADCYLKRNTGQRQYLGPTKAAVSLIYIID